MQICRTRSQLVARISGDRAQELVLLTRILVDYDSTRAKGPLVATLTLPMLYNLSCRLLDLPPQQYPGLGITTLYKSDLLLKKLKCSTRILL